jgi:hydrogenase maturation protease
MRTLVVGLGNPILTDDGVGIWVVRAARACCQPQESAFVEASVGGLRLLDVLEGYERVILVDAIQTPGGKPGDVRWLRSPNLGASFHSGSSHDLSLAGALDLGRGLGMALPDDDKILILAIEVEDVLTFGETCTAAVSAAIPRAVETVLAEITEGRPASIGQGQRG